MTKQRVIKNHAVKLIHLVDLIYRDVPKDYKDEIVSKVMEFIWKAR